MLKGLLPVLVVLLSVAGGCAHRPLEPPAEGLSPESGARSETASLVDMVPAPERPQPRIKYTPIHPDKDPRYHLPQAQSRALTIYLGSQTFEYLEDDRVIASGPVSSGSVEHPTPTGSFRVLSKEKDKRSGKYTNYFDQNTPMPYSLQFYGPYFIHEGWLPGYADSHGCVRLSYEDAKLLFSRMKVGDPVQVVAQGEARVQSLWGDQYLVF
jgi:lipoprotein-anchoring transpeptidase ErfK/SrfK